MTDLITANPNLRGVFASNLIMAQGAGQAIAENKAGDKIKLVGFDTDDKLVKFLKDGVIAALVVQDPFRMGYDGVKTALAASKGEKVAANVDTGANLITKANMNERAGAGTAEPQGQVSHDAAAARRVRDDRRCPTQRRRIAERVSRPAARRSSSCASSTSGSPAPMR